MAAVVFRVPQATILGIVGDAVVGAALQQALALSILIAVSLTLSAKVATRLEVAAVLPSAFAFLEGGRGRVRGSFLSRPTLRHAQSVATLHSCVEPAGGGYSRREENSL